jgi:RNA polymerase sigma-70 factor (ECF subfamily)
MHARFATTHWSVIREVSDAQKRQAALEALYKTYWEPVCFYLRRRDVAPDEVEDVAQDFFLHFFDRALERAEPARGRFRSFLLGALDFHCRQHRRHGLTQKRGGGIEHVPVDMMAEELPVEPATPEVAREFDSVWAKAFFEQCLRRFDAEAHNLCGTLTREEARALVFSAEPSLSPDLVQRFGITPTAAKSRLFRLRRRFRAILHEEARRTVADDSEVEPELRYLFQVLGSAGP